MTSKRLMLVHAHPDDESSQSPATLARYVAEGAQVTLVTCTLGEYGEVVHPDLEHVRETLGSHRLEELAEAMAALGVTDFVRLGGDGTYHDSGMVEVAPHVIEPMPGRAANAFWDADLLEAATHLVALLRDRRPHVVVTYNPIGGYGHPDHVQAHRVTMYAVALAGVPSFRRDLGEAWQVPRVLWGTFAADDWRLALTTARQAGLELDWEVPDSDDDLPPMVTPTHDLCAHVDRTRWHEQAVAALAAHRSQVDLDEPFWRMMTAAPLPGLLGESYVLAAGVPYPEGGPADDLFAGLDLD